MARKPVHLEFIGGKGLRQRLWERMRAHKGEFGYADIAVGAESLETIRDYVLGLERAGFLTLTVPAGHRTPKRWRLILDIGAEAPRVTREGKPVTMGLAQEQMWRLLRALANDINARELAAHASTPQIPVRESAAADYLHHLNRAGYLTETKHGHGTGRGGIPSRYRLAHDTGPRPPMVGRTRTVYDPNLGRVVWHDADITEEDIVYGK